MKTAKVLPIFKKGDTSNISNYRPISLLSSFSKILERVVYNKIFSFLDVNNILCKYQYGLRPKHNTIHPLIHLLDGCAHASNCSKTKYILAVLCDLSKAYDVIDHNILLQKWYIYISAASGLV